MKKNDIIKIIDNKIIYRENFQRWLNVNGSQSSSIINESLIEELKHLKKIIQNYEKERR